MKVEKLKKIGGCRYQLLLEKNNAIIVYEDIVIKYGLFINKEINYDLLRKIVLDNLYATSYNLALKYINTRLRTKKEIEEYLDRKKIDDVIIKDTVDKLIIQGYINDKKLIEAFINDKIMLTNWGPHKIVKELENLGINYENDINKIMSADILTDRINKIIKKQLVGNKKKSLNMIKNKILNYLINLGYSKELIIEYIDNIELYDEEERYQNEYNKLYNKYKNKYQNNELKRIIRDKLYRRGFNYKDYEN